jgi:hypothetical protein
MYPYPNIIFIRTCPISDNSTIRIFISLRDFFPGDRSSLTTGTTGTCQGVKRSEVEGLRIPLLRRASAKDLWKWIRFSEDMIEIFIYNEITTLIIKEINNIVTIT